MLISTDMATAERPKSRSRRRQSLFEPRDTGFSDGGHNTDSGSSTADKLQQEILRPQDEIKVFSAQKAPVRRQSIRQALQSDDFLFENLRDSFELDAFAAAQHEPPRTSARRTGKEKGKHGERPSFTPVSATEQLRNVKVDLSARKSRRKSVAPAVPLHRSTGHGAFGTAVAAGSSRPDEAGATMGAVGDVEKSRGDNRAVPEQVTSKKVARKPLTLEKYDGSVPLETFLAKFQNCAL